MTRTPWAYTGRLLIHEIGPLLRLIARLTSPLGASAAPFIDPSARSQPVTREAVSDVVKPAAEVSILVPPPVILGVKAVFHLPAAPHKIQKPVRADVGRVEAAGEAAGLGRRLTAARSSLAVGPEQDAQAWDFRASRA